MKNGPLKDKILCEFHIGGYGELISLFTKQQIIISSYLGGKSYREIAKEHKVNRKTVAKYIKEYESAKESLFLAKECKEGDKKELIDAIIENPKYDCQNRTKRKLTPEIIAKINFYLRENEEKAARGQRKQQKKKIDIYEAIVAEGYDISYPTVCNTIRELKNEGAEAYIRAEYLPGDVCEFDWGEVKIYISGKLTKFQMAVFTSAKGNLRYASLFAKQDTPSFLEAHALFFEHIDGVYQTMVYDNMKVAIKGFVGLSEKEPTENLLKLSIYYGFKFRFCNIRAGNEKGHVERSVDYIRRKAFAFKQSFTSIDEANDYLLETCEKLNKTPQRLNDHKTANEMFDLEKDFLLPNMSKYDAAETRECRVNKYSTITIKSCYYSVPDNLVGKILFCKIYSNKIICYYQNEKVAEHERKYGFNEWSIKIEHYLKTFKKKPGALASSLALHQANPRLQKIYKKYYIKKEKEFIELLHLIAENDLMKIEDAIKSLEFISPLSISTEKIKTLVNRKDHVLPMFTAENEIYQKSSEMLNVFKQLIPESNEDFREEYSIVN